MSDPIKNKKNNGVKQITSSFFPGREFSVKIENMRHRPKLPADFKNSKITLDAYIKNKC